MAELTEQFIAKFDTFASSLEPGEQTMLISLLQTSDTQDAEDEAEVTGFGQTTSWPGLNQITVGPGGTGWLKDPGTDQVSRGTKPNDFPKQSSIDGITVGPGGNGW